MGVRYERRFTTLEATCDECDSDVGFDPNFGHEGLTIKLSGNYGSDFDTGFHSPVYVLCPPCARKLAALLPKMWTNFEVNQ